MNAGQVAAGAAGGYLLGRFRKMRLALTVAAAVAQRRLRSQTGEEGRGGALVAAGRAAALAAATRRIEALSERMAERTSALRAGSEPTAGSPGDRPGPGGEGR